jgi:glycosyltransferase involved in cell wall biosynthesis
MSDGSGINIKMLDYMSHGLPVVTTECGARGIDTNGKQPMIISGLDKFIDNIKMLDSDSLLCERLSKDGRSLVTERYDWQMISNKLQHIIMERVR